MENGGTLAIKVKMDNNNLVTYVTDTGCGIPKENIRKLFDPFFTTKSDKIGTGLGLSVAYGIIQRHTGSIEVIEDNSVLIRIHDGTKTIPIGKSYKDKLMGDINLMVK